MATAKQTKAKVVKKPAAKVVKEIKAVKAVKAIKAPKTVVAKEKNAPPVKKVEKPVGKEKVHSDIKTGSIELAVVDTQGKKLTPVSVSARLFAEPFNSTLIAQAIRVYLANQREGSASTKTRGEVEGSTRKIYKQKGTGRARHGGIRAPIFVGGGVALGPRPKSYRLDFPVKMRRKALGVMLTSKQKDGKVIVVAGLLALEPKTKIMAQVFNNLNAVKSTLFVLGKDSQNAFRAARNLAHVDCIPAQNVHPYAVYSHDTVVIMKEALAVLEETFVK
jgi:large subunit ribosomal protein L4